MFSVIHDIQTSANNLNKDLERISSWTTQWKMNFNPDTTKEAQKVILSHKLKKKSILHYYLIMLQARTKYLRKIQSSISLFKESFASIDKVFFLGGKLGTRLYFHEVLTLF